MDALSPHMLDADEGKGGDGDGVALVAAEAVGCAAIDAVEEADVIAAWTGHDDGVATLPEEGLGEIDGPAPGGPADGAVVLWRAAGGGFDADVATEAATPGGLAVVAVQPGGGHLDPAGNVGVGA